jgi:cephalosporin hydroxylase
MWSERNFLDERSLKEHALSEDSGTRAIARDFVQASYRHDYCYMWDWLGFPILQMPEDIVALQEILFRYQPSVFIETGVAWGGGVALAASIMSLYNPTGSVLGVDLNLRPDLSDKLENLGLPVSTGLLQASSISDEALAWCSSAIGPHDRVMVLLDSHHTHDHVLTELNLYSALVSKGQYLIVGDTSAGELAHATKRERPWTVDENPLSAVREFLAASECFEQDLQLNSKLLTTFHPLGYLRKLS